MVTRKTTTSTRSKSSAKSTRTNTNTGTSIVRNTSVSSANVTPSYNIVNMPRRRGMCEKEKIGLQRISAVSPIVATKVDDEEYKISLNFEALKDVFQGFDELDLCGVNVKLCTVSGDTVFSGSVTIDDLTSANGKFDMITVSDTATINKLVVEGVSEFQDDAVFQKDIEVQGMLNTNGITNTGEITTDKLTADEVESDTITTDELTVNTTLNSLGETNTNGINNTGSIHTDDIVATTAFIENADITNATIAYIEDITIGNATIENAEIENEKVTNSEIDTLVVNEKATVKGDLQVDGKTDVQEIEVNGKADFREDVKVYDDFYVSGDTTLNGDTKING
jgi:hypothetical protein